MRSSIVSVFSALSLVQFSLAGRYRVWTLHMSNEYQISFYPSDLFGGEPLASSAPPWDSAEHHILPYQLWGNIQRPLPTNVWWQNMVQEAENGEMISVPDPYIVKERLTE